MGASLVAPTIVLLNYAMTVLVMVNSNTVLPKTAMPKMIMVVVRFIVFF